MTIQEKRLENFRKLLVLSVNHLVTEKNFSLIASATDFQPVCGWTQASVAGYPSIIIWKEGESAQIQVSLWWNYDHAANPLSRAGKRKSETFDTTQPVAPKDQYSKFIGGTVSGWIERQSGIFLQGVDRQGLFDTYLRRDMFEILDMLSVPRALGYRAEGKFYL